MDSFIGVLAQHFRDQYRLPVVNRDSEMLVTVLLKKGREQKVKLSTIVCSHADGERPVIRIQTRVCIAENHKVVHGAIRSNAKPELYAFALDHTSEPPMIDLLCHCPVRTDAIPAIYSMVMQMAERADAIEAKVSREDMF